MDQSIIIQEINNIKSTLATLSQQINNINYKLQNNIGMSGPPGPQGNPY